MQVKLGRILKETRIKRGISLSEVARELLIQEEYIEAIEDGIDEVLPSGTYKRIYSRAYCKFLGIEYKDEAPEESVVIVSELPDVIPSKKDAEEVEDDDNELDFDLPFDINRAFRVILKLAVLALAIWAIIKIFQWIF